MTYLLDTNVCIRYLNGRSQSIFRRIQSIKPSEIAVCSIVKMELFYGALRSQNPQKALKNQQQFLAQYHSYPFDDLASAQVGEIRATLANLGTPIGSYDLMIASIAIVNDLILVTHNVKEYERVPDLNFEDWE